MSPSLQTCRHVPHHSVKTSDNESQVRVPFFYYIRKYAFTTSTNIIKLAHIRMDFAGIMQTIGIKGRYVGFTYIRPLYGFAPFWRS